VPGRGSCRRSALLTGLAAIAVAGGCGGEGGTTDPGTESRPPEGPPHRDSGRTPAPTVVPSHCPPGLPSCRSTAGPIVYVERVDPDGDGDAHFVVADRQGVTLPGLTAIDVRKGLRPHPLPGPGDFVSAAGPVQSGSYGQSQIHALELHVAER
jgi:hypothetical protein